MVKDKGGKDDKGKEKLTLLDNDKLTDKKAKAEVKVNHCYLFPLFFMMMLFSSYQAGYCMFETTTVSYVLAAKEGWIEDGTYDDKSANLGVIGLAGVALGSSLGTKAMLWNGKNNINRVLICFNLLAIIANGIKCYQNYYVILVGRFFFGLFAGANTIVFSKII